MTFTPFEIFTPMHLLTIAITLGLAFFISLAFRGRREETRYIAGVSIAVVIVYHMIRQTIDTPSFGYPWQQALPLHMCDLSSIAIAVYLVSRQRIYFVIGYFWGIGGATMAIFQPDLQYFYPHITYVPFFVSHGLILLGVFYALIALHERPVARDILTTIGITICAALILYPINLFLGENANFWYLTAKPQGLNLMTFFPEPPFHLVPIVPLVIFVFCLLYLPFGIRDYIAQNRLGVFLKKLRT